MQSNRLFAVLESKPLRLSLTLDVPKVYEQLVYFVRDSTKLVTTANVAEVRGSLVQPAVLPGSMPCIPLIRTL